MRKFYWFVLILVIHDFHVFAVGDNYPVGARQAGMANAAVMLSDLWSISHNQAGLVSLDKLTIGFFHENKFIVSKYAYQALVIAVPVHSGVLGASVSYFGYSSYNEIKAGLAYGKSFGKILSAGLQLDYCNTYVTGEYGNRGALVVEAGLQSQPIENLLIGVHVFNPLRAKIAVYDENIPTILRMGVAYRFSDKVILAVENEKDMLMKPVFKTGIEYHIYKNFFIRTGVMTNPTQLCFGIGYIMNDFQFDMAVSNHPELGITPHFSLSYHL
ncbi:MAG: hypothetical protein NTW49_01030 [Bacteroidia bacterium]|nr:hypothetical protein [Bacteroidia bacterium]